MPRPASLSTELSTAKSYSFCYVPVRCLIFDFIIDSYCYPSSNLQVEKVLEIAGLGNIEFRYNSSGKSPSMMYVPSGSCQSVANKWNALFEEYQPVAAPPPHQRCFPATWDFKSSIKTVCNPNGGDWVHPCLKPSSGGTISHGFRIATWYSGHVSVGYVTPTTCCPTGHAQGVDFEGGSCGASGQNVHTMWFECCPETNGCKGADCCKGQRRSSSTCGRCRHTAASPCPTATGTHAP